MGLFIAATYAARIGARLSFRPGEPGGAVFELTLPLLRGAETLVSGDGRRLGLGTIAARLELAGLSGRVGLT